jgi:hypothetical protein
MKKTLAQKQAELKRLLNYKPLSARTFRESYQVFFDARPADLNVYKNNEIEIMRTK